jgi:hypothetical protein
MQKLATVIEQLQSRVSELEKMIQAKMIHEKNGNISAINNKCLTV